MFGSKPVVNSNDDNICLRCDLTADDIVRVEIPDHPAAAVKEDERREHAIGGSVQAQRNRSRL